MWLAEDPWQLPSTHRLLGQVAATRGDGGAWLRVGPDCPDGLLDALVQKFGRDESGIEVRRVGEWRGVRAASAVSQALIGQPVDLGSLVAESALADHVVIVDLREALDGEIDEWKRLLTRLSALNGNTPYWAIVIIALQDAASGGFHQIEAQELVRRIDSRVWAGLRLSPTLQEPVNFLAESLAVELGGADLDFVSMIVESGYEDLLDPKRYFYDEWKSRLNRRGKDHALASFEVAAWRAQLQALFPWLEALRQEVVRRHRKNLVVDQVQAKMGVEEVEELELGAIARQLSGKTPVHERDYLWGLAKVRNALAHHRLAPPSALDAVIKSAKRYI